MGSIALIQMVKGGTLWYTGAGWSWDDEGAALYPDRTVGRRIADVLDPEGLFIVVIDREKNSAEALTKGRVIE